MFMEGKHLHGPEPGIVLKINMTLPQVCEKREGILFIFAARFGTSDSSS